VINISTNCICVICLNYNENLIATGTVRYQSQFGCNLDHPNLIYILYMSIIHVHDYISYVMWSCHWYCMNFMICIRGKVTGNAQFQIITNSLRISTDILWIWMIKIVITLGGLHKFFNQFLITTIMILLNPIVFGRVIKILQPSFTITLALYCFNWHQEKAKRWKEMKRKKEKARKIEKIKDFRKK
jgi:hypothetical protein